MAIPIHIIQKKVDEDTARAKILFRQMLKSKPKEGISEEKHNKILDTFAEYVTSTQMFLRGELTEDIVKDMWREAERAVTFLEVLNSIK